ncbi:S9 family peptidase [Enemella evansiae]|uniref:alpha/beta hydrolase family protein n=1 Tax=Enemella evansiae TaxID=2016499 RepID=UPI000B96F96B|nr:prolyl oligopeptidase family serine peptidase [Enemella evansiae]OYN96251.1 S9 family peptidase [Enemella evansiae]
MTESTSNATGRPTFAASVAPDGSAFAHLVEVDGYPRAVQRWLRGGLRFSGSRFVRLPVEGPVSALRHSPDGKWLALEIEPHGSNRHQVWVVTTDPEDPQSWRIDDGLTDPRANALLIGWDGQRIALAVEGADDLGEARLVDPATREVEIVDRRREGRLFDSWGGAHLIRTGPRSHRGLILLHEGRERELLGGDPGSSTEQAQVLTDRRPSALPAEAGEPLRLLVRSDHGAYRSRLLRLTIPTAPSTDDLAVEVLAERAGCDLDEFAVSADGRFATLLWNVDGGHSVLQLFDLRTDRLLPPLTLPAEVASEASLSAEGSLLAVTAQGPEQRRTVSLIDPRDPGPWIPVEEPPEPRGDPVLPQWRRFPASDGLELNGWWYAPPEGWSAPGPVALWFHGGPEGQSRPEYSYVFPTLLAAGIAVFAPNVRGSGGFGRAFVHADEGPLRHRAIADVVDVVGHLVGAGLADPERIAITGRSYGGYLTNAALAFHPGLFRAGVAICGMSDLQTFYRDTEPWIGLAAYSKYGHPVHDAELLAELSPLHRVAAIEVPLLTLHGSADTNVPVNESRQVIAALAALGRRTESVVFPGEGHEFTRPENQQRLADLVRDWIIPEIC